MQTFQLRNTARKGSLGNTVWVKVPVRMRKQGAAMYRVWGGPYMNITVGCT